MTQQRPHRWRHKLLLAVAVLRLVRAGSALRPNLLLLFPDEWRWDFAGFDPEAANLRTPNVQNLARNGTRFTAAYTPSAWCTPARACLASVRDFDGSPQIMNGNDFPVGVATWYQALRAAGYHTMIAGKDDLCQSQFGTYSNGSRHADVLGLDDWFRMQDKYITYRREPWDQFGDSMIRKKCGAHESGKDNLFDCNAWCYGMFGRGACCRAVGQEGFNCNNGLDQVGENQEDYVDNFIANQAMVLLDRAPPDKPWMLHVSFPGPHPPFIITEAMNRSIAGRSFPSARDNAEMPAAEQEDIRRQYAAEIENLDALFGTVLAKVRAMGQESNTLVVVTSDHGEQLGDQHAWGKKMPWEPSIRVPLIISGPGVAEGRQVDLPVSTLDVVGTFLQRAGAETRPDWQAQSLEPLLRSDLPAPDERAYLGARPFVPSGLTYPGGHEGPAVDYRAAIVHVNATHVLKVICCPKGCPPGNTFAPSTAPRPQLLAFNVAPGAPGDAADLGGSEEARELARRHLPGPYATACLRGPRGDGAPVLAAAAGAGLAATCLLALCCCCLCLLDEDRRKVFKSAELHDEEEDESGGEAATSWSE